MVNEPVTQGRLLVDRREAAHLLSLSERTVFTLTDAGELPTVRIGRAVRYPVTGLIAWIERSKGGADHD